MSPFPIDSSSTCSTTAKRAGSSRRGSHSSIATARPWAIAAVLRDVTPQKEAEDQIRLAVERRDAFLAMLSHELRNPLSAIVCAAKVLGDATAAGPAPEGLDVIDRQSRHMARLLDDLLEVNRVTHNKIALQKHVFDLRRAVADAVSAVQDRFETQAQKLDVEVPSEPLLVDGDPARLQQIIVNLLGNANRYTPKHRAVSLVLRREEDRAVVTVKDDGNGIDPSTLDTIFEMFVQGNTTIARAEGGMGLGLTLVRALAEMHGGAVSAKSDGVGKGSEFVVLLPLAPPGSHEVRAPRSHIVWGPKKRIALIDDNVDSCAMLEAILRRAGYEVFSAHDGHAGLGLIDDVRPDVAIVDIGLPGLDGYEVTRRVRARPELRDLFMVAVTGYGRPSDRAMAMEAGFDDHLVKPFQAEDIGRVLDQRALPR